MAAGVSPASLYYDQASNRVYCTDEGSDQVTVLNCATNQVIASVAVGQGPRALAGNPFRNRVYVANYYGSSISVLNDSAPGIEESLEPQVTSRKLEPTVVRGVLFLPEAASHKPQATSRLLDISGRKVLDLHPGANDVSRLAPGVYFVLSGPSLVTGQPSVLSGKPSAVTKIVITR